MTTTETVILAIVEGLTEFIPVSSTGHLILTEALLKMEESRFLEVFTINVQLGAILAVIVLYWRRFFQSFEFYMKLFVAFLPAAVVGLAFHSYIKELLGSVTTVAVALIVGGVVIIICDRLFEKQIEEAEDDHDTSAVKSVDEFGVERTKEELKQFPVTWLQAFMIGCFQCLGMIPGVSRSAATIVGGLTQKMNIKRSSEFSFFLAVPTIFAASMFELKENFSYIKSTEISSLLFGSLIAFVVGMLAIRFFIGLITSYGLKFFGYYRIIIGVIILVLIWRGYDIKILDNKNADVVPTEQVTSQLHQPVQHHH